MKGQLRILVVFVMLPVSAGGSELKDSLREHVEGVYAAFKLENRDSLDPREFSRGFGFRTRSPRSDVPFVPDSVENWGIKQITSYWLSSLEYYNTYIEEAHYHVEGNVGMAWGFHIEEFKSEGKPAERVRVRFSSTYVLSDETMTWLPMLSHRDIQEFRENGSYIPTFVE